MRELIASHGAWALSAMTAFVTVLQGKKVPSAWLVGLVSQAMWLVWIWSTKQWGLLPLTFVLVALYLRNHVLWNEAATEKNTAGTADAARYRKLQGWMSSNVQEGWQEVERMGSLCAWVDWGVMDAYLDGLPECRIGLMSKAEAQQPHV